MSQLMTREEAKELARDFSGHDNEEFTDILVERKVPSDLAEIGTLIELQIFLDEDEEEFVPIRFAPEDPSNLDKDDLVLVGASRDQLYLLGGDQDYEDELEDFLRDERGLEDDEIAKVLSKDEVILGPCKSIAYYKAKHHLEGEPKKAIVREHQFAVDENGEPEGDLPMVVYHQRDKEFRLVGGSYTIEDEGIAG